MTSSRAQDITILTEYLSSFDTFTGFDDVSGATESATTMYQHGADGIVHAAGTSGLGHFDAATSYTRATGRQVWAIGVDTDQYETVLQLPGATDADAWREHILTSVLKGIDAGIYKALAEYARGEFKGGLRQEGHEGSTSGISYSGGYIDDLRPLLENIKARIISGEISVPCIPPDRLDEAAALGLAPDNCPD